MSENIISDGQPYYFEWTDTKGSKTSEMVERVARAMCAKWYDGEDPDASDHVGVEDYERSQRGETTKNWHLFERPARAAIEAMREPTEAMTISASKEFGPQTGDSSDPCDVWRHMIDEALK